MKWGHPLQPNVWSQCSTGYATEQAKQVNCDNLLISSRNDQYSRQGQ